MIFVVIWQLVTRPYLRRVTVPYLRRRVHHGHHRLTYGGALMMPMGCVPKHAPALVDRLRLERTLRRLVEANDAFDRVAYRPRLEHIYALAA